MTPTLCSAERIRELNDACRAGGIGAGRWMITRGVAALGAVFAALAVRAVRDFDRFDADDDPHGEHDFAAFDLAGERLFWKIDCYEPALSYGSADPTDPAATARVLTVMLAHEY